MREQRAILEAQQVCMHDFRKSHQDRRLSGSQPAGESAMLSPRTGYRGGEPAKLRKLDEEARSACSERDMLRVELADARQLAAGAQRQVRTPAVNPGAVDSFPVAQSRTPARACTVPWRPHAVPGAAPAREAENMRECVFGSYFCSPRSAVAFRGDFGELLCVRCPAS